jgi:hypothetical protein
MNRPPAHRANDGHSAASVSFERRIRSPNETQSSCKPTIVGRSLSDGQTTPSADQEHDAQRRRSQPGRFRCAADTMWGATGNTTQLPPTPSTASQAATRGQRTVRTGRAVWSEAYEACLSSKLIYAQIYPYLLGNIRKFRVKLEVDDTYRANCSKNNAKRQS